MKADRITGVWLNGGVTCKLEALCFYSGSVQVDSSVLRNLILHKAATRYSSA